MSEPLTKAEADQIVAEGEVRYAALLELQIKQLENEVDALERELNAANQRIKQLEQLGDVLAKIADENPYHVNDVTRWLKAKEAKL